MASKTRAIVFISSRKQAMEIIPVAITRAKYPGNKSAAARKTAFRWLVLELLIKWIGECVGFFVATLAIEFKTDA